MKCPKCGNNVPTSSKFCPVCGSGVEQRGLKKNKVKENKPKKKIEINVVLIIACLVLLIGIACFVKLNFFGDELFAKLTVLQPIQLYVCGIAHLVILVISFILAIIARTKKTMKQACTIVMLIAIVTMIGSGAYFGINIINQGKAEQLLEAEVSDENIDELQKYYDGLKTQEQRDEFVQKMLEKVEGIKTDYLAEKIDVQTAEAELEQLAELQLVHSDIDNTKTFINDVESSKMSYSKAKEYEQNNDYIKAIDAYSEVISQDEKNYADAQTKITEITSNYKNSVIEKVNGLAGNQQYQDAMNVISDAENAIGKDNDLETLKSNMKNSYVDTILAQVESLKGEKKYSDATQVLNDASKIVSSPKFSDELSELENYKDILFNTLKIIDSSGFDLVKEDQVATDVFGNSYTNAYTFVTGYGKSAVYMYFNTNGYYQMFSATVAASDSMKAKYYESDNIYRVEVYADDELVYTSPDLIKTSQPLNFDVDVNYAKIVQVKILHLINGSEARGVLGNGKFHN